MAKGTVVTCLECGTQCGGAYGKDTYKHLIVCLQAEPDNLDRMRETADQMRSERGKRIVHLVDALQGPAASMFGGVN